MALLDDLASHLQTQGIGTVGSTLFKGVLPDTPDACVAVLESPAMLGPVRTRKGSLGVPVTERPRVQVLARATSYQAARNKAVDALAALDWLGPVTLNSVAYQQVEALQRPPFPYAVDANGRQVFAFNVEVTKAPST